MNERRLASLNIEWGDGEGLVKSLREISKIDPKLDLSSLNAPENEFFVSPMTLRATLLGAKNGRHFYHQELRSLAGFPDDLRPEIEVGELGTWSFGALEQPKYFSFYQDAPCPAFNPNHRTKWRAHEMMHGMAKFFWNPKLTRFAYYISVRLNETLPVVHWYHFDEIDRPRCPQHQQTIPKQYCSQCDAALPYWEIASHRSDAVEIATRGFVHFSSELAACMREIESGEIQETFYENLNSSTDAIGYMRSHWNRVTSWSFGLWMELFSVPQVDHFESIREYGQHISNGARRLFNEEIVWDREEVARLQKRKRLQDISYRYLLNLEHFDDASFDAEFDRCEPWLERMAAVSTRLLAGEDVDTADLFLEQKELKIDPWVFQTGFDLSTAKVENIEEGLQSAGMEFSSDQVREFISEPNFYRRGPIADRFCEYLGEGLDEEQVLLRAMSFYPRLDLRLERFGMIPDSNSQLMNSGVCLLNESARMIDETKIGFYFGGEFRVLDFVPELGAIFRAIDNEEIDFETLDGALFWEGLNVGLIGWYPN